MRSLPRTILLGLISTACGGADSDATVGVADPSTGVATDVQGSTTGTGGDAPTTTGEPGTTDSTTDAATASATEPATDSATATSMPGTCGNGQIDAFESCDDGPDNADDAACTSACQVALCGDGLVRAGVEQCDDGNDFNSDACIQGCRLASCGDGYRGPGEACDDGNNFDDDGCPADCSGGGCGDGFVEVGEACDDGNKQETDACLSNCELATCGDGFVQTGVEACDDANKDETDACSATCEATGCFDGMTNGTETDVDCGGASCGDCLLGGKCAANFDCADSICKQGTCVAQLPLMPPNCQDAAVSVAQAYGAVQGTCNCHANGPGGLTFSNAASFRTSMVGVDAQIAKMKLVTAGDIDHSYLLFKILNQQDNVVRGGEAPMPIGKILSDAQKCTLINWVKSGAK